MYNYHYVNVTIIIVTASVSCLVTVSLPLVFLSIIITLSSYCWNDGNVKWSDCVRFWLDSGQILILCQISNCNQISKLYKVRMVRLLYLPKLFGGSTFAVVSSCALWSILFGFALKNSTCRFYGENSNTCFTFGMSHVFSLFHDSTVSIPMVLSSILPCDGVSLYDPIKDYKQLMEWN